MRAQDLVALWLDFFEKRKGPLRKDDKALLQPCLVCRGEIEEGVPNDGPGK